MVGFFRADFFMADGYVGGCTFTRGACYPAVELEMMLIDEPSPILDSDVYLFIGSASLKPASKAENPSVDLRPGCFNVIDAEF